MYEKVEEAQYEKSERSNNLKSQRTGYTKKSGQSSNSKMSKNGGNKKINPFTKTKKQASVLPDEHLPSVSEKNTVIEDYTYRGSVGSEASDAYAYNTTDEIKTEHALSSNNPKVNASSNSTNQNTYLLS